ncbi:MAG: DUF3854 domain-containing protein, partial [Sphaerospermopsis kisseleviana]
MNSLNLPDSVLQSKKYQEVRAEWLQNEKLSSCEDYFDRLIAENQLLLDIPVPLLAKLLFQDPSKQHNAIGRAYKYRDCWAFKANATPLDVIQIKVPKSVQDEIQRSNEDKQRREGGDLKKSPKYLSSQGVPAPIFLMPIEKRDHQNVVNNPNVSELVASTWEQVKHDFSIPIIIIEGAKKGAVLAAHGYFVIVLPGVWQG